MNHNSSIKPILTLVTVVLLASLAALHAADLPQRTPASPVMHSGPWLPENPHQLDFASLPKVPSEHAVVSDVRDLRSTEMVAKPNSQPALLRHGGFKLYDQPNLELGRDKDQSAVVGSIKNIRFEDLTFHRPGKIEVHANTDGLVVEKVDLHHPLTPGWHLLALGSKSQTYKHGGESSDSARWVEIFSPDLDCTVRNVTVTEVRENGTSTDLPLERVVKVIEQKPNPDYPKTTPKGGTGNAIWIR